MRLTVSRSGMLCRCLITHGKVADHLRAPGLANTETADYGAWRAGRGDRAASPVLRCEASIQCRGGRVVNSCVSGPAGISEHGAGRRLRGKEVVEMGMIS